MTELQVAAYLMDLGFNVSQPLSQASKYDLIVEVNGKFLRLQVKTARRDSKKSIAFGCRTTTTNVRNCRSIKYSNNDIDFFATFWNGKAYLIPISECAAQKNLHLEKTEHKGWSCIDDYVAEKILCNA